MVLQPNEGAPTQRYKEKTRFTLLCAEERTNGAVVNDDYVGRRQNKLISTLFHSGFP